METIDYNGMKLEEFTSDKPITFEPAKKMFVWNDGYLYDEKLVLYVNTRFYAVLCIDSNGHIETFDHCAEIPEKQKPRRATKRELAKWLAQGNGEWGISKFGVIEKAEIGWFYDTGYEKQTLQSELRVRKWDDTEWHEPTVDYMGIEG